MSQGKKILDTSRKKDYNTLMTCAQRKKGTNLGGLMKLKRLAALALAGVLCLTNFTGCGIDPSETAATLGDQSISLGLVNFMVMYQKSAYDDSYVLYYGEDVWDMDFYGTGNTLAEDLKDSVVTSLHDMYTLKNHMAEKGVELTAEEKTAIKEATKAFMEANDAKVLEAMGATEEYVEEMPTIYTIQEKMRVEIIKDVDTKVTDEEANMRGISYIKIGIKGYYDSSYNYVSYTADQIKTFRDDAATMLAEMEEKSMEDVAKAHKYTVTKDAYTKTDTGFDAELIKEMNKLKEGETSEVLEINNTLYIVRIDKDLDEEATKKNVESIIATRENELYKKVLTEWEKEDGWQVNDKAIKSIKFRDLFSQKKNTEKDTEKNTEKGTESGTEKGTETTEKGTEE